MDLNGYTKLVINFNGATLCRVNSPIRKFSGSSSFFFNNDELFKSSENKFKNTLEKTEKKTEMKSLFSLEEQTGFVKNKTYSVNKKVISRKIHAFFFSKLANQRFYFYTVSFPIATSDSAAYELFNAVLTRLRKGYSVSNMSSLMLDIYGNSKSAKWRHSVSQLVNSQKSEQIKNYIWVAERQKNGTIHFHIITSESINVLIFNHFVATYIFNSIKKHDSNVNINHLSKSGYNGVDVSKKKKGLSSVTDVRKYLTKYVTKNTTKFTHFAWHCSRSISALFTTIEFPASSVCDKNCPIDVNYKSEYFYESEYYTFIFYPNIDYKFVFQSLISVNNDIIVCFFSQ